uniref:Torsin-1A-interacting protein 1/2 AAA+ activator domain-containing protein n=1 Tax=Cyprinodon variegatus TaxID=28743 RepID=A0A3Q2C8T3_CYPVA
APPLTKEALSLIRQSEKRPDNLKSSMDEYKRKMEAKARSAGMTFFSIGFGWYLWRLVFVVLLSSVALLVYGFLPVLQSKIAGGRGQGSREVMPGEFSHRLSLLQLQFPSQRAELWNRTKIHLEKHLGTADPTEPVSLILAAGRKAEGTLRSLAQDLASTYSFALNAAVIHRFEELPPGSTLIFYRYCDHETAAYKQVFILLTVLLPQDEISSDLSLKDVEETVLNYVQTKLVGSTSDASFNEMDNNKFRGLWSRISHVVLPVVSEEVKQD